MVISSVIRYHIVIYSSSSAFLLGLQHTLFFLLLLSHHSIKQSLWLIPEVSETGQTFRTMVDFALIHCATALAPFQCDGVGSLTFFCKIWHGLDLLLVENSICSYPKNVQEI